MKLLGELLWEDKQGKQVGPCLGGGVEVKRGDSVAGAIAFLLWTAVKGSKRWPKGSTTAVILVSKTLRSKQHLILLHRIYRHKLT